MTILLGAVGGIIFFNFIVPLLTNIIEIAEAKKSLRVGSIQVKLNRMQNTITKENAEADTTPVSAIGFQISSDEYEEDDDFPEEDKLKGRIGF